MFSSGHPTLDLLHDFFLENGARTRELRVYERTSRNVSAAEMCGYRFVRGGVHAELAAISESFMPEYAPEEVCEIAQKLYRKAKQSNGDGARSATRGRRTVPVSAPSGPGVPAPGGGMIKSHSF